MVVTNLRMPADDWMRVKAAAANAGMSANKYIQYMFDEATKRDFFGITDLPTLPRKKTRFYESLWQIIEKPAKRKPMDASEEDKIIYDI